MELSLSEIIGLLYILIGLTVCGMAHVKSYGEVYEESMPVIFRFDSLKRWFKSIINQ